MRNILISLDFEKRWGVHHVYGFDHDAYREELENVHFVIPEMIKMFKERNLRVTWATVGALLLSSWDEYFLKVTEPVKYTNKSLQFKQEYADIDYKGELYFAPELVDLIYNESGNGQELASHSFSHVYFGEKGVTKKDFENDTDAMNSIFKEKYLIEPHSYVFPRNQITHTNILRDRGYKAWRTNRDIWYQNSNSNIVGIVEFLAKSLRFIESVNPFESSVQYVDNHSIPSSLFVRFNLSEKLWQLHLYKIKNKLLRLPENGVLHLWWHPHNLGGNLNLKMSRLINVLDILAEVCASSDVVSFNMKDIYLSSNS